MRICVFGANGPTGRLVVGQALGQGHQVTAFTRHPETFPFRRDDWLRVDGGDVTDAGAVEKAVAGQDAVLSSLGVPFGNKPINVYSLGAENIVSAMRRVGVSRLVAVTSSAVEENPDPVGGFVFRKVVQPFVVNHLGRTVYEDQRRMEAVISESGLDWTIIRPSGLFNAARVSTYEVSERFGTGRFTSRHDLADCMLQEAEFRGHYAKVIAVVTTEGTPGILSVIWNEGIRKGHG